MKKALIFGVTGQDGSYLADLLIEKGYEVHGMVRKSATGNLDNIYHIINNEEIYNKNFFIHHGDMLDSTSLYRIISSVMPDEIYNEADQDHVGWSYDMVGYSTDITSSAVAKILELVRLINKNIRFFQPCSSNMYGISDTATQNESTKFNPQSPYAIAKTSAYYFTKYYRENFGIHASVGILYNHESPRRTPEYVSRKITKSVARIHLKKQKELVLGDLNAEIDWGYAKDYMEAAWKMLQQNNADDYVIGSGKAHSINDFVSIAFESVGLDPMKFVRSSKEFIRPTKTSTLISDTTKAKSLLGFTPNTEFKELVQMMVRSDIDMESN